MAIDSDIDWHDTPVKKPKKETQQSPAQKIAASIERINEAHYDSSKEEAYESAISVVKEHLEHVSFAHLYDLVAAHDGETKEEEKLLKLVTEHVCKTPEKLATNDHQILPHFAKYNKHRSLRTLFKATEWPGDVVDTALKTAVESVQPATTTALLDLQHNFDLEFLTQLYDNSSEGCVYQPVREHMIVLITELAEDPAAYRDARKHATESTLKSLFEDYQNEYIAKEWQMASSYEIGHKSEAFGQNITSIFNFKSNKVHVSNTYQSGTGFSVLDFKDYENKEEIETAYEKLQLLSDKKIPEFNIGSKSPRLQLKKRP